MAKKKKKPAAAAAPATTTPLAAIAEKKEAVRSFRHRPWRSALRSKPQPEPSRRKLGMQEAMFPRLGVKELVEL